MASSCDVVGSVRPVKRTAAEMASELLETIDLSFQPQSVVPGEDVTAIVTRKSKQIRIGSGLRRSGERVYAVRLGRLQYAAPSTFWVDSSSMKRYVPRTEDVVVGIVEDRGATQYRVGISGTLPGSLPILAFQGATKRSKPTLKIGEAVFCRIVSAEVDMEPELSCMSVGGGSRKGWETGEATFGSLCGGVLLNCPIAHAAQLRERDNHPAFSALAREGIPFESCVGSNGVIWLKAKTPKLTVCVANVVANALVLRDEEVVPMVKELLSRIKLKE
jgi:exosome complex component RRP40